MREIQTDDGQTESRQTAVHAAELEASVLTVAVVGIIEFPAAGSVEVAYKPTVVPETAELAKTMGLCGPVWLDDALGRDAAGLPVAGAVGRGPLDTPALLVTEFAAVLDIEGGAVVIIVVAAVSAVTALIAVVLT